MFRMFNFVRSRKNNVCAYIVCISRTRSRVGIPHSHEITIESCCTSRSVKISQPPEAFILQDWLCFKYICILTQFCDVHDGELYTSTRAQSALHKAEYFFCLGQRCCSVSPRLPSWLPSRMALHWGIGQLRNLQDCEWMRNSPDGFANLATARSFYIAGLAVLQIYLHLDTFQ